jgi:two-component system sensor histidine kinase MprB
VVVTVDALAAQVATLESQVRTVTAELEVARQLHHLVGHEVRTPLTVVLGALATLQHPHITADERRRLEARALAHAHRMREVVDDLLAGDAPARGPLPRAELETVPLAALLRAACEAVQCTAPVVLEADEAQLVATAPARLRAIVSNLVDNAEKYGARPIRVSARSTDRTITIAVSDHGPGLRGATPEELFAPFQRGPGSEGVQGTGIGLYLARLLARTLGGGLTLREARLGGVVATVRLPQRRNEDPAATLPSLKEPASSGRRVVRARV